MPAFITLVVDSDANPIVGAVVGLFTDQGVFVTSDITGDDGRVPLVAPDQLLALRVSKPGYVFARNVYMRPVDGASFTVVGTAVSLPATDPARCVVYATFEDPLGRELKALPLKVSVIGRVGGPPAETLTSSTADVPMFGGRVRMELRRGWTYKIGPLPLTDVDDNAPNFEFMTFNVPDAPSANLLDLIAPYAVELVDLPLVLVSAGEDVSLPLSVKLIDGSIATYAKDYIAVEVADPATATASISINHVNVSPLAKGNTTLIFTTRSDVPEGSLYAGRPATELARVTLVVS